MPDSSDDTTLRLAGFRIASRPAKGPVMWSLGTRVFTQAEAVQKAGWILRTREKADKRKT